VTEKKIHKRYRNIERRTMFTFKYSMTTHHAFQQQKKILDEHESLRNL